MSSSTSPPRPAEGTRHVAVCAYPFGTHPATLLQVTRQIGASVPQDSVVGFTFLSTASSNMELFGGVGAPDNILPYTVEIKGGEEGRSASEMERFLEGGEEALRKSIAEAEEEVGVEIGCVVADAYLWFTRTIAEDKGVPWVPLWTSGPASLSAHVSTDLFRTKFGIDGIEGKEHESADLIPGFSSVLAEDLPEGIVSGDLASPMCQMLHNVGLNAPKATAVSINSFQDLDPMINHDFKSKLPGLLNVGPFSLTSPPPQTNLTDDKSCISWLDHHKDHPSSVVYVSFGRITTPSKDQIKAIAEVLEAKGQPFLWSLRKECHDLLPNGFVERIEDGGVGKGKVVAWAPQFQVLRHPSIGVFVTHCGWNSVMESIVCGVPMICVPFFYDQKLTSKFIESVWKIGIRVEGEKFTKEGVEKALNTVLSEEEGKEIKESVQAFKEKAEEAVRSPDGSSIKDIEKLVDIVIYSPKKDKDARNGPASRAWRKWFKVFRVWRH